MIWPMSEDPAQDVCPASPYGETHHLVPRQGVPTCTYCGKTREELTRP